MMPDRKNCAECKNSISDTFISTCQSNRSRLTCFIGETPHYSLFVVGDDGLSAVCTVCPENAACDGENITRCSAH